MAAPARYRPAKPHLLDFVGFMCFITRQRNEEAGVTSRLLLLPVQTRRSFACSKRRQNRANAVTIVLTILILGGFILWNRRDRNFNLPGRDYLINLAIREGLDIRLTYWSNSQKRFVRQTITPVCHKGDRLEFIDPSQNKQAEINLNSIQRLALVVRSGDNKGQKVYVLNDNTESGKTPFTTPTTA
jgi:hypothetical protein